MTIVRRALVGIIVVAVVGVWAASKMHGSKHYSDTPGQGAALERQQLGSLGGSRRNSVGGLHALDVPTYVSRQNHR